MNAGHCGFGISRTINSTRHKTRKVFRMKQNKNTQLFLHKPKPKLWRVRNTKEMIDILDADIKEAKYSEDYDFVYFLQKEKNKLVKK